MTKVELGQKRSQLRYTLILIVLILMQFPVVLADIEPKNLAPTRMSAVIQQDFEVHEGTFVLRNGQLIRVDSLDDCEVGDVSDWYYKQGWLLTFTNCGEAGGTQYGVANLYATSAFTRGRIATKKVYVEANKAYSVIWEDTTAVQGVAKQLLYTYKFSGGPDGEFTLDGETILYLVDGGARVYNPVDKIYYQVRDWEKGFQVIAGEEVPYICSPTGLNGQVEWSPTGERNTWKLLQFGDKLPENAHIKTQEDSSCILSFPDMSTYAMKAESHIVLTTDPNTKRSKLSIAAGKVWVDVKKMLTTSSMEVEMQQAVCGIKGTTFVCEEVNGVSTLKVIEGTVELTSKLDGKAVLVEAGQQVLADGQGLSEVSAFNAETEAAEWNALETLIVSDEPIQGEGQGDPTVESKTSPNLLPIAGTVGGIVLLLLVFFMLSSQKRKKASNGKLLTEQKAFQQDVELNFCVKCGQKLTPGAGFCAGCGNPIQK